VRPLLAIDWEREEIAASSCEFDVPGSSISIAAAVVAPCLRFDSILAAAVMSSSRVAGGVAFDARAVRRAEERPSRNICCWKAESRELAGRTERSSRNFAA
jgi:hypothetical protein